MCSWTCVPNDDDNDVISPTKKRLLLASLALTTFAMLAYFIHTANLSSLGIQIVLNFFKVKKII